MQLYGIIGDPVEHSLSPAMHEAAYDALDIDASYVRFHVSADDVDDAVTGARALGVDGFDFEVGGADEAPEKTHFHGVTGDGT